MDLHSKTPIPRYDKLPKINDKPNQTKNKIILKKHKTEEPNKLTLSWTSKLLNWRAILEDQREYRQMIIKIELYNQIMKMFKHKKH